MSAQLAVRGGTVVDGTGAPGVRADVGIADGRVVEIADRVTAPRELDAAGHLVVPGFVDVHTHYDPQVLWDAELTPSSTQGVTTVVAGNCGYSLAPLPPEHRASLLRTLEGVEDMRLATLEAGIAWDFESYAEYLDAIGRRGVVVNFGGYVGHTPVRLSVLGDDAYERAATPAEIDAMRALVAESLLGGALGFSSDRAGFHLGDGGRPVPSMVATQEETEALMRVTAETGRGVVHVAPGERYAWLYDFQRSLGRRITWSALLTYPESSVGRAPYREKLACHLEGRARGADVWAQVTCRPILQHLSMADPSAFYQLPAFAPFVAATRDGRVELLRDPTWRARVADELDRRTWVDPRWATFLVAESPTAPQLEGRSVADLAAGRSVTAFDVVCDVALADDLGTRFSVTFANDEEDGVALLLGSDGCVMGLSDAGAHVSQICDAVMPTDFLSGWVRDRALMPMEAGVRKLTGELADVVGVDRGYLRVGAPADLVVLDWAALHPGPLRRVRDMPAGGERLVADAPRGIAHVLVNGTAIREGGEPAPEGVGARPGAVLGDRTRPPR